MSAGALIVAAGRGSRVAGGASDPKQYWPIGDTPMLTHAETFQAEVEAFLSQVDESEAHRP